MFIIIYNTIKTDKPNMRITETANIQCEMEGIK